MLPQLRRNRHLCPETGETFGSNSKIFLSQVISFVIVALLLRQFAYKPILAVLEERRQQIAEGLLNAEKIKQQLAEAEQRQRRSWPRRTPRRKR